MIVAVPGRAHWQLVRRVGVERELVEDPFYRGRYSEDAAGWLRARAVLIVGAPWPGIGGWIGGGGHSCPWSCGAGGWSVETAGRRKETRLNLPHKLMRTISHLLHPLMHHSR